MTDTYVKPWSFQARPVSHALFSSVRSTAVLGLGATMLLLTAPATAKATRPQIRTATALTNLRMSMPVDMKTTLEKDAMGLDIENADLRKTTLAQAQEYIAHRKGQITDAHWEKKCAETTGTPAENPFCRWGIDHQPKSTHVSAARAMAKREERRGIQADLQSDHFERLNGRDYQDLIYAVGGLPDSTAVFVVASHVLEKKACVPSGVASALAYKIEEWFPTPDSVETSKKLYKKASDCGTDMPAAKAGFRLGLINIWQNNCAEVGGLMLKVEKIREASQYHARAKYWRHFCAGITGDETGRKDAKESLLRDHPLSFHNLAVNGDDPALLARFLHTEPPQVAFRSLIRPEVNSLLRAAEGLIRQGAPHLAAEFFDRHTAVIGGLEPEVRLYTASLLSRISYALPKFKILSSLFQDTPRMVSDATLRLLFPLWFFDLVKKKEESIDPLLILSLIRQESAFNKGARSIAGARGLMQVMPATARMIASIRKDRLFDPQTNIRVGTKYLLKRLHQYSGDVELTLAAYNAGFARVDQWRKRYPTDNKMLFLDFIPFRETRDYVSSILRNYYWYVKLYEVEPMNAATASTEGVNRNAIGPKTLAIMSANAGAAATTTSNEANGANGKTGGAAAATATNETITNETEATRPRE